jgi:hypothetical protein
MELVIRVRIISPLFFPDSLSIESLRIIWTTPHLDERYYFRLPECPQTPPTCQATYFLGYLE